MMEFHCLSPLCVFSALSAYADHLQLRRTIFGRQKGGAASSDRWRLVGPTELRCQLDDGGRGARRGPSTFTFICIHVFMYSFIHLWYVSRLWRTSG